MNQPEPEQLTMETLHPCPTCKGTGQLERPLTRLPDSWIGQHTCRTCGGAGNVNYDPDDKTIPYG